MEGGAGNDTMEGGADGDQMYGDEVASAVVGNDTMNGGGGNDGVYAGGGDDDASGGAGDDTVWGDEGNDRLDGDGGDDDLYGELGRDVQFGGNGADTFHFLSLADSVKGKDADIVRDFSHKEGDLIDLSVIDAKEGGADNAFKYIGDDAFTGKKGQLRFDNRKLTGDTDGDGKADFMIKIDVAKLVAGDFVL
jgi:Ca2+-binding RTX toxin-like protein